MVLGKMAWDDSMYGNRKETACLPVEGAELGGQLANAIPWLFISRFIVPSAEKRVW